MINLLHNFNPGPILVSFGPVNIYWYGIFIALGILTAILISFKLASFYNIAKNTIFDLAFYVIIAGLIGARIYYIFLELPFYLKYPLDIFKVWNGGLAIHGGLLAGILTLLYFTKKKKLNFWQLAAVCAPGLVLAQAIGRWGNYFNQELYGGPTGLPWGIPILPDNRITEYFNFSYFHPAFLYESIGNFLIFLILISIHVWIIKKHKLSNRIYMFVLGTYLSLYSVLRFFIEFIRVDNPIIFGGFKAPQIVSLAIIVSIIVFTITILVKNILKKETLKNN